MPPISVIICSYNSRKDHLRRTLESLAAQTLAADQWELLIVDNASTSPPDTTPFPKARVVREEKLGLSHARLRGFREALGRYVVTVDDDNVLDPDYLEQGFRLMEANPTWGAIGGRNIAEYETPPPDWLQTTGIGVLACRDPGKERMVASWKQGEWKGKFPWFSPVGAGMFMRREITDQYIEAVAKSPIRSKFDRVGSALSSGGDNDIVLVALTNGWESAYCPELRLLHLIGSGRLTAEYQARLHYGCNRSWAMLLAMHGISPWPPVQPWTVPLREWRAWFRTRAWSGPARHIKWRALCGLFNGRADVMRHLGGEKK